MNPVHQRTANDGSHEEHRKARFLYLLYYPANFEGLLFFSCLYSMDKGRLKYFPFC